VQFAGFNYWIIVVFVSIFLYILVENIGFTVESYYIGRDQNFIYSALSFRSIIE